MKEWPSIGRFAIGLLGSMAIGCVLLAGLVLWLRPHHFETHQEAIGYVLSQHGIAYEHIDVEHVWPDTLDRNAYAADVTVQLPNARPIAGRIICTLMRSNCYVRLARLNLLHEPVPELSPPSPWLSWLKRNIPGLAGL